MLEKFKQLLHIGEEKAEEEEKTAEEKGTDEVNAKTYEELFADLVRTAEEEAKREAERFQEKTKRMIEAEPTAEQPQAKAGEEPSIQLDENATVNDLLKLVMAEVDKRIQQAMQTALSHAHVGIVESIVRENPQLKSVEDEAVRIVEKLPPEAKRRETVEMLMWALKGMKSEAEKRSFATELLESIVGEKRRETSFVPLPYSASEIEDFAQKLRLEPSVLKKRLAEQLMKGGLNNE